MKKLIPLLFTIFLLLSPFQPVKAATPTLTMSAPATITAGQQFTVTIGVANVTNMFSIIFDLKYESAKLSYVSIKALEKAKSVEIVNNQIQADFNVNTGQSGTFTFVTVTFKAKTTFEVGQSAYIELANAEYSDNIKDFYPPDKRIYVKMISNNTYLKSLTVSSGTLNFSKSTTSYSVVVDNSVSSLQIAASAEDGTSSVAGAGTKNLSVYTNEFNVVVTAANGSTRNYSITVVRKDANGLTSPPSTNNNLKEITIAGFADFNASFKKDQLEYTLEVGNLVTDITLTASAEDSKSKVDITKAPLNVGPNTITIVVTAESGAVKTYTITVNRSSDVPTVNEDEIIAALANVTTPSIGLNAPLNGQISIAILDALKSSGKILVVVYKVEGRTIYEWRIDGSKITNSAIINTLVLFDS
ncbi:MAG: glycoside hydrolase family 73 protein [Erysipelotrichaceae bacterium]|nr:MAG: glycoside hydrolase family 73 protein [Erysipelotrichaceae bacterium]